MRRRWRERDKGGGEGDDGKGEKVGGAGGPPRATRMHVYNRTAAAPQAGTAHATAQP